MIGSTLQCGRTPAWPSYPPTSIMHQPPILPHKEGVGGGNGQIVQHLGAGFKGYPRHQAI